MSHLPPRMREHMEASSRSSGLPYDHESFARMELSLRVDEEATQRSIAAYLARKNSLMQKQTMGLLKDYLAVVESGPLLGARAPLGRIGNLFVRRRPALKARLGLNPATEVHHE